MRRQLETDSSDSGKAKKPRSQDEQEQDAAVAVTDSAFVRELCAADPASLTRGWSVQQLCQVEAKARGLADHIKQALVLLAADADADGKDVLDADADADADMPRTVGTSEPTLLLAADESGKAVVVLSEAEGIENDLRCYPNKMKRVCVEGKLGRVRVTFELEDYFCQASEENSHLQWRLRETRSGKVLLPHGMPFLKIDLSSPTRPKPAACYGSGAGAEAQACRREMQGRVRAGLAELRERSGCGDGDGERSRSLEEWVARVLAVFYELAAPYVDGMNEIGMLNTLFCELGVGNVEEWELEMD